MFASVPVSAPAFRASPGARGASSVTARPQSKPAGLGYVPRVTEKPLFPGGSAGRLSTPPFHPSPGGKVSDAAGGLQTLLNAVAAFQRDKRLKEDLLVSPGGPTERALDAQNEKARRARLDRLETVSREIMDSDAPEYAPIADRAAADTLAGLIVANEVQDQREAKLAELRPPLFLPRRSMRNAGWVDGNDAGGSVPVAGGQKFSGPPPGSSGADPVTHGNRLGRRIREERARRERFKQKEADPVGAARGYVAQIGDKQIRRAVGRVFEGAKKPAIQSKRENLVNLEKDGGRKRAVSDFERAVREAGGDPARAAPDPDGMRRFTARDGTVIMYREVSKGHGRTNEIHIIRPGEKKGIIKIRYPEPPAKEIGDGPAYP